MISMAAVYYNSNDIYHHYITILQGVELVVKGFNCTSGGRQVFIPLVICTLHFYKLMIKI